MDASGLRVPLRAASCCSKAFDSKYSSHAAASYKYEENLTDLEYSLTQWMLQPKASAIQTKYTVLFRENIYISKDT